ncbi:MAG: hypothetical protein CMJ46_04335, partial [Planctomyces sp.]|nr:hypothetical protein [Planctomyces sp.]
SRSKSGYRGVIRDTERDHGFSRVKAVLILSVEEMDMTPGFQDRKKTAALILRSVRRQVWMRCIRKAATRPSRLT